MKNFKRFLIAAVAFLTLPNIWNPAFAQQQQQVKLHIGDTPPQLKYSKWIKGLPVDIKGDRIYVVECWATWCKPCIAAMPHLTKLAKQYADKVIFIGANVWEQKHDKDKTKPYEIYLPKVEKFVNLNAERMDYHVIADNNAQDMANNWLTASGQLGIPSTFVIKNNKLMWIGHPMKLDSVLTDLVNGNYNVAEARRAYEKSQVIATEKIASVRKINKEFQDAVAGKDFKLASSIVMESSNREPLAEIALKIEWFEIQRIQFGEAKAIAYLKELVEKDDRVSQVVATQIAKSMADKAVFLKENYRLAASILLKGTPDCLTLDKSAEAFKRAGDFKEAFRVQIKAVELAKIQSKDPDFAGRVFDQTVIDYQQKADVYQKLVR